MSAPRKTSTARTRAYRERQRAAKTGKILPFMPRTTDPVVAAAEASPGDAYATWGPNSDRPPMVASNFDWKTGRGKLLAVFTLTVPHWHAMLLGCRLMQWGKAGERVLLPQQKYGNATGFRAYSDIHVFTSDEEQRAFEEQALKAVRVARKNMPPPVAGAKTKIIPPARDDRADDGVAAGDADDVPF